MNASVASPTFSEVAEFVREFAGLRSAVEIHPHTRLDADLGVTGGDGDDLLLRAAEDFDARLLGADGYITTFGLAPNEYLFHPEGLGVLGIGALIGLLTGHRKHVVRDLTVGELHAAICSNRSDKTCADCQIIQADALRGAAWIGRQAAQIEPWW